MKRIVSAAVLGAVALGFAVLVPSSPAYAAQCSAQVVTVVVQFPDGHTEIGCTSGDPANGLAALKSAGFPYEFVPNQYGAVCTIKGAPSSRDCWNPPHTWSYWRAAAGGTWVKSELGAGSTNPAPGTVEGWRFGTSAKPDTDPPAASTPAPTKAPTAKATRKPTTHSTATPVAPDATATASASARTTATATATASDVPASALPTVPTGGPTAASATSATDNVSAPGSDSSGMSWIWGLVLLGILAAVGGAVFLSRRRA